MKKIFFSLTFLLSCLFMQAQFSGNGPVTLGGVPAGAANIQWYNDGGDKSNPISGATSSTYTATTPGTYYAAYDDASTSCTDDRTVIAVILDIGGSAILDGSTNNGGGSSYQWLSSGSPIAGANAANYTTTAGGSYVLTYDNGTCVISGNEYYVIVSNLSCDLVVPTLIKN